VSTSLYPTLVGAQKEIDRVPFYSSIVQREAGGRELRVNTQTAARYRYRISYDFLRQDTGSEAQTLLAFFATHRGSWDSFLLVDPYNDTATTQSFGTGDGSRTVWYLTDEMGERIGANNNTPSIYKAGALQTVTTHYTLDSATGKVTFVSAPANGNALTWTGTFYRRVRFSSDELNVSRRGARIWRADVELVSVLP
jgi:uncharacterized protein (TIGR02217 family)